MFVETVIHIWWLFDEKKVQKNSIYSKYKCFINIINAITVTFDKCNAYMLKNIFFIWFLLTQNLKLLCKLTHLYMSLKDFIYCDDSIEMSQFFKTVGTLSFHTR